MDVFVEGTVPTRGTPGSAGGDLRVSGFHTIQPGAIKMVSTGVKAQIPFGYVGLVFARSSLAQKHGLKLVNGVGVIDSDYRGEIHLVLENFEKNVATVRAGDRLAQIVIMPCYMGDFIEAELNESDRGGFGSTGRD